MIRLATVFSGIGAIEHAFDRMGIDHTIVFACDNGDIDILGKDVGMNIDEITSEIEYLKNSIQELQIDDSVEDLYKQQLFGMFVEAQKEQEVIVQSLSLLPGNQESVAAVLRAIINTESVSKSRKKFS